MLVLFAFPKLIAYGEYGFKYSKVVFDGSVLCELKYFYFNCVIIFMKKKFILI